MVDTLTRLAFPMNSREMDQVRSDINKQMIELYNANKKGKSMINLIEYPTAKNAIHMLSVDLEIAMHKKNKDDRFIRKVQLIDLNFQVIKQYWYCTNHMKTIEAIRKDTPISPVTSWVYSHNTEVIRAEYNYLRSVKAITCSECKYKKDRSL